MPVLPVVCHQCEKVWVPETGGVRISSVSSATIMDVKISPCPHCGGTGSVPDGVYHSIEGSVRYLLQSDLTKSQLKEIAQALAKARTKGATPDEVRGLLAALIPGADFLMGQVPDKSGLVYWLMVLAIASYILSNLGWDPLKSDGSDVDEEINRIVDQAVSECVSQLQGGSGNEK